MVGKIRFSRHLLLPMIIGVCLLALSVLVRPASALTAIPTPSPETGAYGLEATKKQPPPTVGATITTPGNGASFSTSPITVNGICPDGLLVQVYDNGVMVGAVLCKGGSFTLQVSLFAGVNELTVIDYDDLEQAGPTSAVTTVNYTDTKFNAFGASITLTTSYGRRAAPAGSQLTWPLQLQGGAGPYAFSIDWGDGSAAELKSQALAGVVTINHVYKKAGVYQVNIKVTDVNGFSAFLQVVAVSSGKVDGSTTPSAPNTAGTKVVTQIMWIPTIISLLLLVPSYWLGRRSQIVSIRNKMLKERDSFKEE